MSRVPRQGFDPILMHKRDESSYLERGIIIVSARLDPVVMYVFCLLLRYNVLAETKPLRTGAI